MQNDEHEIRQLVATWMAATQAGDFETVLGLMADDVVFLMPGQPPLVGKARFAAAAESQSRAGSPRIHATSEIKEIQVMGDWAFMWAELSVHIIPPGGGSSMARAGHTLSIFKKQSGKWLLARDANMLSTVRT